MAKVIATAWGTRGDVIPYVAVCAELRKRGHDVKLLSNPTYESLAREAGLSLVPVGTRAQHEALVNDPKLWNRDTYVGSGIKHFLPLIEESYRAVTKIYRPGETVLIPSREGAWIAREKLDIPTVALVLSPAKLGSRADPKHPSRPFPAWTNRVVRSRWGLRLLQGTKDRAGRWRTSRGRPTLTGSAAAFMDEIYRVRALAGLPQQVSLDAILPRRWICLWPSWFSPPQKDWPPSSESSDFLFYPKPRARRNDAAVDPEYRPIVFTRGSAAGYQKAFFVEAVRCCVRLRRPGVLLTPHRDDVPSDLPPRVRHVPFAPLGELFGRARAVVHHGGVGTMGYAFAAGIPQIVVPIVGDQFDLGYRMERQGVGSMLTETPLTAARLARELRRLETSTRVRRRCASFRDRIDPEAATTRAADAVEEVIASTVSRNKRARPRFDAPPPDRAAERARQPFDHGSEA